MKARSEPLVSIVIPTYNRVLMIKEAVDSCLAQTWPCIEVIIIDDGSNDTTEALVAKELTGAWAGRNIRYSKQQNRGASAARNAGLGIAKGDYVQFLDSDDLLFPDKIALQISTLTRRDGARAAGCSCYGQLGQFTGVASNRRIGVFCNTRQEYLAVLASRIVHGMQTSAPLWRRAFLANRPGWRTDINLGDDLEYYVRILTQANEIKFVEKELFLVRHHDGPRLSDAFKDRLRTLSAIRARQAIFDTLRTSGNWEERMQRNFLGAMRTLYANLLSCGAVEDINHLERWLLQCSRTPRRFMLFPLLIAFRKLAGKRAILKAHSVLKPTFQLTLQ